MTSAVTAFPQQPQPIGLPTPEVRPSIDQQQPVIGPNLAVDVELGQKVGNYLVDSFWRGFEIQQMRLWTLWRQMYEAWAAKVQLIDFDIPAQNWTTTYQQAVAPNARDGFTQKLSPTILHRQWDALLKMYLQISYEGGGIPVSAVQPNYVFETLYNPTQQSIQAFNEVLEETAHQVDLKSETRKNFHQFLLYGHAWAHIDCKRSFENVDVRYNLGADPNAAGAIMQMLAQKYQGQQPILEQTIYGPVAIFKETRIKELYTSFRSLNVDDVFTDLTMSCDDMDKHSCPWVRQSVGEFALEQNLYDPQSNAFGWVNTDLAREKARGQYVLTMQDETPLRQRLMHRYNINDQTLIWPEHTMKQLWTAYAMIRLTPDGKLDTGDGVDCQGCNGTGSTNSDAQEGFQTSDPYDAPVDLVEGQQIRLPDPAPEMQVECPHCQGKGKMRVPAERYVAQFYGNPRTGGFTCIRLQKMPKGMKVPLTFAADMIEDTACAIPTCKGEVAMNDFYIASELDSLFLSAKRRTILRGFYKKIDSPSVNIDGSKPNVDILIESNPDECRRIEADQLDETITIAPFAAEREARIMQVLGATPEVLGQISKTHISASQFSTSYDASKNPLIVMIDGYNHQQLARGWAAQCLQNLNLWGDRDWIRQKTGREYFPEMRLTAKAAEEFVQKISTMQNQSTWLQVLPSYLPLLPELKPVVLELMQRLMENQAMGDIRIPDSGLKEAQQEGMRIVSKLLGDAEMTLVYPLPDDPDDIFIQIFQSAIRNIQSGFDYWSGKCDSTLPLLYQRLQLQQQQAMFKMQQQMMLQAQQQALMNPQPKGQAPSKNASEAKPTPGGMMQQAQAAQGANNTPS